MAPPPIPAYGIPIHGEFFIPDPTIVVIELALTILAVALCFAIFFKTKESYELTRYAGIKYFRYAFLFFGLSYILGFFSSLTMFSRMIFGTVIPREIFGPIFILPLGYLSTMAILYLMYSSVWKKFENQKLIIVSHIVAITLTVTTFLTRSHLILLYLQTILLIMAIILGIVAHRGKNKISQIKIMYFIVLGLWLVNLFVIGREHEHHPNLEIILQIVSLAAYAFIYYKVSKWVK